MDNKKLTLEVENHVIYTYDTIDHFYMDNMKIDKTWTKISAVMKVDDEFMVLNITFFFLYTDL